MVEGVGWAGVKLVKKGLLPDSEFHCHGSSAGRRGRGPVGGRMCSWYGVLLCCVWMIQMQLMTSLALNLTKPAVLIAVPM